MVVDDVFFMSILKGKRIKLTLKSSSYSGVVQRVNPNKTLILSDVTDDKGCKVPGTKLFFGHEIVNVETPNEESGDCRNNNAIRLEEQLWVEKFQPYKKTMALDDDEGEEQFINFTVIDEFHEKFGPAVMDIKKQHVIGVGAEGVAIFKNGRLCWLQIATKKKVYLFDILLLGVRAFKNGLAMILESKHILKVIHDCRAISGCLNAQFGVKMTNVFDTQVADLMCFYTETGGFLPDRVSTLVDVVCLHLKVPPSRLSSLQVKTQLTQEEREMWYIRPVPVLMLKVMALSVIHLQPLRLVLLDALMTDYMVLVDSYLNSKFYAPDELGHVRMESVLELPNELREMDKMRCERREWATSHYPVTKDGLLARFNPYPESSSQASPAVEQQRKQQPVSFEPATLEPPSSPNLKLLANEQSAKGATAFSSLDVYASSNLPVQSTSPATLLHLEKETSANTCLPAGVGRGCKGAQMGTIGRGRSMGKEPSSATVLPCIGRGFFLQIPSPEFPRESARNMKTPLSLAMAPATSHTPTKETEPQPGSKDKELLKDTYGLKGGLVSPALQSLSSSLSQSFRSFRD